MKKERKKADIINFTKHSLNGLLVPEVEKPYICYDSQIKGLMVMVFKSGRKTFYLSKKVDGKAIKYKLGVYPDLSVENARKAAHAALTVVAHGINPQAAKRTLSKEITLGDYFDIYLKEHAKPHKKTWQYDEAQFNRCLEDWKKRKLSTVTTLDIRKKHAQIGEENGIYSANRMLALLSTIYNKAIKDGVTKTGNPVKGVQKFKEKSRDRFLQPQELKYFWEAVIQEDNTVIRDFIMITLLTGARRSNVQTMQWRHINLERGEWRIPDTKNGDPLTLPLSPQAAEILNNRKKEYQKNKAGKEKVASIKDWVFESVGKAGYLQDPKKAWKRIHIRVEIFQLIELIAEHEHWSDKKTHDAKKSVEGTLPSALVNYRKMAQDMDIDTSNVGLGDLRIHDLRRTLGSWQAATGANSFVIGKSLGHKSQAATAIYARLNLDPVRQSVNTATEAMLMAVTNPIKNKK
jgi:integrase